MKPSRINPTGVIGNGNPPGILRARVVNILPSGVIMVSLLAKPLEKNLRSTGPLTGRKPIDIKVGALIDILRNRSGSFDFVRIAETEAAPDLATAIRSAAEAIPTGLEIEQTERHQIAKPAIPPAPLPAAAPEISGAYKAIPTVLENAVDLLSEGKRLNKLMIQHPSAETKEKAARWIAQANEMIASFRSETEQGWTSNLVRIRGEIDAIAEVVAKLSRRIGQNIPAFVIPVPETIALDITPRVKLTAALQPIASKPIVQKPVEAPIQKVGLSRPLTEEEQIKKACNFSPLVWTSIKAHGLLSSNRFRSESLEEVRQLYARIDELLRGNNLDEALKEERKTYGTKPVKQLYLEVFQEFAVKFYHYVNTKGIDPEILINNHYRKVTLDYLLDACVYFDRDHLERDGQDFSEKEKLRDLAAWLKFLLTDNNLTLEYPGLRNDSRELNHAISVFRGSLKIIGNYPK